MTKSKLNQIEILLIGVIVGTFEQGCVGCEFKDALPIHKVTLDGFWLDKTPVTNELF